jgi:hypothetical protein
MFRTIVLVVISVFISTVAYAHDDWEHRHHHRHRHQNHRYSANDPFYRSYMPPMRDYYRAPNQYYAPRPMPYFDNDRYEPRYGHHGRDW